MRADTLASPARDDAAAGTAAAALESRRRTHVVVACHFVASFAALGLPPYFTEILPRLGDDVARWAGVLYVVPTVCVALTAPVWGRLADRFGRRALLLRAQLGLAVSFWLASRADTLAGFTAALVLQGLLGGTFSASHAYLASALRGEALARGLTLMQASARAALVAAPVTVGVLARFTDPQTLYGYLAVLPLVAAALVARLPEPRPAAGTTASPASRRPSARTSVSFGTLCALEAAFVFATVVSFPYFLALVDEVTGGVAAGDQDGALGGTLFALPHLVYLAGAGLTLRLARGRGLPTLTFGLALVAVGLGLHALSTGVGSAAGAGLVALLAGRLVLGLGLTAGLVGLSILASDAATRRRPGALFGTLELFSKGGAVLAGLAASAGFDAHGPLAPVLTGALAAACAAGALALTHVRPHRRHREAL